MANDNWLAALTGVLEGASQVVVPFAKKRYETNLELELARAKIPAEIGKYRQEQQIKSEQDIATEKAILPTKVSLEEAKQAAQFKRQKELLKVAVPIIGPDRNIIGYTQKGAIKLGGKLGGTLTSSQQDRVTRIDNALTKLKQLRVLRRNIAGSSEGIIEGAKGYGAGVASHLPVVKRLVPDTLRYKSEIPQAGLIMNAAVVGGNRPTNLGLKADVLTLPDESVSPKEAEDMFNDVEYYLTTERRNVTGKDISSSTIKTEPSPLGIGQPQSQPSRRSLDTFYNRSQ